MKKVKSEKQKVIESDAWAQINRNAAGMSLEEYQRTQALSSPGALLF